MKKSLLLVFVMICFTTIANSQQLILEPHEIVRAIKWSPDGTKYAIANPDGNISVWSNEGNLLWNVGAHQKGALSISWSPDGSQIASSGFDSTINIWNTTSGDLLRSFEGIPDGNFKIIWTPIDNNIAILGFNLTGLWDATTGNRGPNIPSALTANDIAINNDGDTVATVSTLGQITVSSLISNELQFTLSEANPNHLVSIDWHSNSNIIAVGSKHGLIQLWDLSSQNEIGILANFDNKVIRMLAFSPDGTKIATSVGYDTIYVLDASTGATIDSILVRDPVLDIAWHPSGDHFIYGDVDGTPISITPNTPPAPNAGTDQTISTLNSTASITLDGSESSDVDGSIVSYIWTDLTGAQVATGVSPTVDLPVGAHTLTLTVTDDDGATASDEVVIEISQE